MAQLAAGEGPFKEEVQQFLEESGIKESSEEILGPFSDLSHQIAEAVWNAIFPSSTSSLWWPLLALTVLITVAFWVFRKGRGAKDVNGRERPMGPLQYLLPKRIYTHPSARVDIWLYLLDKGLMPVWVIAFLGSVAPFVEQTTIGSLQSAFGASPELTPTVAWRLVYGIVTLLIVDMIFFFTHYMMHKTEIGWAIHKVHHSAQVLTPLTRPREHFIAAPVWALGPAIGLSISGITMCPSVIRAGSSTGCKAPGCITPTTATWKNTGIQTWVSLQASGTGCSARSTSPSVTRRRRGVSRRRINANIRPCPTT